MKKETESRIDTLNKEIKKCYLKNSLCSRITMISSTLLMVGTSVILIKNPTPVGAFTYTASALAGMGTCIGIGSKLEKKNENKINDCINELHGYALEENQKIKKK